MCNLISKFVLFAMLIMVTQPTFAQLYEVPLDQRIDQSEVIVEGEVISSKAFRGSDDNIYTSHRVAVSKVLTANQVPATVEIITFGGELDDELQTWTHLLTLNQGDKGVFFLNAAKPKDAYFRSAVTAYDVYASSQGFVQYRTNEAQALVAVEPFKQYNDIKQEIFARIEQKKGHKATLPESASVAMFRTGIRFHFKNIAFDGLKVKFDLYVNSLVGNKVLNSAGIQLSYNPVFFGPSVVNNGGLSVFENGISLDYGYDFSAADVSSTTTKISLLPNPALGGKVEIGANEQLLGRGEFVIQNPLVDPGITYNIEQSKAFNTYFEEGVNKQFDTVVVVGSWRPELICPKIDSISPKIVASGVNGLALSGVPGKITIHGKNFGVPSTGFLKPYASHVLFHNIDVGFFRAAELDYISWSDTKIEVEVSAMIATLLAPPPTQAPCATTGPIAIFTTNFFTGDTCTTYSKDSIYVRFGMFNRQWHKDISWNTSPGVTQPIRVRGGKRINLVDYTGLGGYTYQIKPMFTDTLRNNAVSRQFKEALDAYRCTYKIFVTDTIANADIIVQKGSLPTGVPTTTMHTTLNQNDCINVLTDADAELNTATITVNDQLLVGYVPIVGDTFIFNISQSIPLDTSVKYYTDFQATMIHELGHVFQLQHTANVGDMMQPGPLKKPQFNNFNRSFSANDILGIKHLYLLGKIGGCFNPAMKDYMCISSTNAPHFETLSLFPNPSQNQITLVDIDTQRIRSIAIVNAAGVATNIGFSSVENGLLLQLPDHLPFGVYMVVVTSEDGLQIAKILKQ
jgi:hypothetical protein